MNGTRFVLFQQMVGMVASYGKMAWRALMKNKLVAIINIGGLSLGLALGVLIVLVVKDELKFDRFHKNGDHIYLLMSNSEIGGTLHTNRTTPAVLAPVLKEDIPEAKWLARTSNANKQLLQAGESALYLNTMYADPDFFQIMSFPALEGNAEEALKDPGSVLLTRSAAARLFGASDPIGQVLTFNSTAQLKVAALLEDPPLNSSTRFDVVLPFSRLLQEQPQNMHWGNYSFLTWMQTRDHTDIETLNKKLAPVFSKYSSEKATTLFAYPLERLRLHGRFANGKPVGGTIYTIWILSLIAFTVILIACVNFMNLSTARAEGRAREVGVRKAIGASRKRIIIQFLFEAMLMAFLAFLLAIFIAWVSLPGFMLLIQKRFVPEFADWTLWLTLLALTLATGFIAGSYPAFYLSRFQPVKVLRGVKLSGRKRGRLRKALVTAQFAISVFLILATIVAVRQIRYLEERPIGYAADQLIDVSAHGQLADRTDLIREQLAKQTAIASVTTGSDDLVRFGGFVNGISWPEKQEGQDFSIAVTTVGYDWVQTTGLTLVEGRDFSREFGADSTKCLINESAARRMDLKAPVVGTKIGDKIVIGVVRDFVFNDPAALPKPLMIFFGKGSFSHLLVRIPDQTAEATAIAAVQDAVKKVAPDEPFEYQLLDEKYRNQFNEFRSVGQLTRTISILAILISCLGLFGLSAFVAERRGKEISIRKVLGAPAGQLYLLLSREFLLPVLIAFLIIAPLTGWLLQQLLQKMDYHIKFTGDIYIWAAVIIMAIALFTVSYHAVRAIVSTPVKKLKEE